MRRPPFNPYIAIFIGVICISTTAVLVKLANEAPAEIIATYRLFFAALIMLPVVLVKYRQELKLLTKKDWILSIISSVFLALHFTLWFEGLNYTSVASSAVLITLQPIFTFLGTYFLFKDRFSQAAIISMFITLLGSFIIHWGDFQLNNSAFIGDVLTILAVLALTIYFVIGKSTKKKLAFIPFTFIIYSMSSLILIIYNLFLQNTFIHYPSSYWFIFVALATIPVFFGHTLFNWALKWVTSATVSVGMLFTPVSASILSYLLLKENISWSQWLGGSIIIFGLFLFIMGTRRKRNVTISERKNK